MATHGRFECNGCGRATDSFDVTDKNAAQAALNSAFEHERGHITNGGHAEGFTFETVETCPVTMEIPVSGSTKDSYNYALYRCTKVRLHNGSCRGEWV